MRETDRQNVLPTGGVIFISTNSQQPLILLMVLPRPYRLLRDRLIIGLLGHRCLQSCIPLNGYRTS